MAYVPMSSQTVLNVSLNCKILYAFPMFPIMFQQFSHITHIQSLTLFHIKISKFASQSLIQTVGGQEPGVKVSAHIMSELPTALGPLILGAVIKF
jgi:hypothetical protein